MTSFVQLQNLLQRALTRRIDRNELLNPKAQSSGADAVQSGPLDGADARSHRSAPVEAIAVLDRHTDWPTHRIRCFLHAQPARGVGSRR